MMQHLHKCWITTIMRMIDCDPKVIRGLFMSKIEWTEKVWNPVTGCDKVTEGCKYCYAETMAVRLKAMGTAGYENGFEVTLLPERLEQPVKRKKPTLYFVNSMSDLFHEAVPFDFIDKVFDVIQRTPHHVYQILTKRERRMAEYFSGKAVPGNAWIGVTVENQKQGLRRLPFLRQVNAVVRFLSIEPLLEDLGQIDLSGISWVIVGGESGRNARAMEPQWARSVVEQCLEANVPVFFKQWGTFGADGIKRNKKKNGRLLDGSTFDGMPLIEVRNVA